MPAEHAANNDVSYLIDAQAFYVRHINSEPGSEKLVWDYDNMYWAMNVFLAQVTNDGALHVQMTKTSLMAAHDGRAVVHSHAGWLDNRYTAHMPVLIVCNVLFP